MRTRAFRTAPVLFLSTLGALLSSASFLSCARALPDLGSPENPHALNAKPPLACTNCHDRPTQVQYPTPATAPTAGHFAPQECSDCHQTLAAAPAFVFNHKNTEANFGATCLPCHEARRPTNHNVGLDCASCHRDTSVAWIDSGASPHPAGNAQLTSCANCHASDRPSTVVNRFNHAIVGMGDCISCHGNPGVSWTGGTYNHSPVPASCSSCHLENRPALTQNFATSRGTFSHGRGEHENYDCTHCHVPSTTWQISNPGGICSRCH